MAQRKVCAPDVGLDLREQRRKVVPAAPAQHQRPLKDRRMDQQVSARLNHQLDAVALGTTVWRGRNRADAGVTGRAASRTREGGPFARSDDDRQHAAQHDHTPPRPAAHPGALTPLPQPRHGPSLTPGRRRAPVHHRDPSHPASAEPGFQPERPGTRSAPPRPTFRRSGPSRRRAATSRCARSTFLPPPLASCLLSASFPTTPARFASSMRQARLMPER
jgi:hypothetical protein